MRNIFDPANTEPQRIYFFEVFQLKKGQEVNQAIIYQLQPVGSRGCR